MTSSLFLRQEAFHAILHGGFWKSDTDFMFMFNWHFLSILNGLDVIWLFVFGWDFPTGGEILGVFGQNAPQNGKWEKKTCWEGTSLRQTASFEPLCVKLSLSVWIETKEKKEKEKKAVKQEGRSHKKCIFHVCVERPLAGGFQPDFVNMFVSRTLSSLNKFIVITSEISELWGVEVSMLP